MRGILAQRQVTVRVAVRWASHVDACARVLAVCTERTRFSFHHSVRVTLYAAHRARQRVLFGHTFQPAPPHHKGPAAYKNAGTGAALSARPLCHSCPANISHQQLAYQKFRTWAALVTHKLGDRDRWLTAAMCDTLHLAGVSQHRSMKQRQESLEEVRACMSRWLMEYQAWVDEIAERWSLVRERKKRPASGVPLSPGRRFKRYRMHHPDTPDYIQLTGYPELTDPWEIEMSGSPKTHRT